MPHPDLIYSLINGAVMPAWLLLIFAPRWNGTYKIIHAVFYPLLFGSLYLLYMIYVSVAGQSHPDASFTTIKGVQALFSTPEGIIIGWSHYLVFDLFVGAWIARDAARRGIAHLWTVPCLFFTFMLGPLGLLLYIVLRKIKGKGGWSLIET